MFSCRDMDNVVLVERGDAGRNRDHSSVFASLLFIVNTALAKLVETPCIDLAVIGDSEGVV